MKKYFIYFYIILVYSTLHISCKKDEDTNVPQIIINSPTEFKNYKITDTVTIKANVTDDKNIVSINIVICNTNYLPVTNSILIYPNVKSIDLYECITIDDFNLPSGTYYVKIRAFDGENEKNLYRAITIEGIQRCFKSIITINQTNTYSYNVYAVDTVHNLRFSYSGDYVSSTLDNNYQRFYICGNINSNLNAYNLNDNTLEWSIPPDNNPPFPSFENLYINQNLLFVSRSKSYVTAYNRFSNINYNSATTLGYTPKKVFRHKNYLIVEEKNNTSELRFLNLYYYPTGSLKNSTNLSFIIKSIFYKDDDKVLIFGNDPNNNAVMKWFEVENQTLYSPHTMPLYPLKDVVKINNSNYLLIIGNTVYLYQDNTNSLTVFIANINAENIDFEDISQTVIVSVGNTLKYYNYPSATQTGTYTLPYPITKFHLLYNKEKE